MKRRRAITILGVAAVMIGTWFAVPFTSASAAVTTTHIEDGNVGTGVGQVQYSAGWNPCAGNCPKGSNGSFRWTSTVGSSATLRFSGHQIVLSGLKEPWSYISTVSIDGRAPVDVDEYAATATSSTVVYTSPTLAEGTHTLVLTMTGRKNAASTGGISVTFDRADVHSNGTSTPPAGSTHASGLPWSDGGFFEHDASEATAFAAWRGRPVDNIVAFTSRDDWNAQVSNWWASSVPSTFNATRDDFILSVALWDDHGLAGTDAQWKQLATEFAAVDPNGYLRLGWEMNCCFSLAVDDGSAWRAEFSRAVTLIKSVAPGVKIVFNPNEGVSGDPDGDGPIHVVADASSLFIAGKVDVIALDAYDWYPAYNSTANVNEHLTKQYGWNWWYNFAQSKGLPFALGEFGNISADPNSGGDNPNYFTVVYNWLSQKNTAKPGSIAFVSLFNAAYCGCNVYPTTPNPQSAAQYKTMLNSVATH